MTKNKRFGFMYYDGVKVLTDSGKVIPDNIALDLLNELANENEKLNEKLLCLTADMVKTKSYEQLEKENKRLKQKIADDFNQSNCITVQKSVISDLKKENAKLISENQRFEDKIKKLLDYVEVKQCVTRTEIKK